LRFLLDTHLLLWAASEPERLPGGAREIIDNPTSDLVFSAASIWEVAIKLSLGREDFRADPTLLRRGLLENRYSELPVTGRHAAHVANLPLLHRDPFDRLLIAQAQTEGLIFVTVDAVVARYAGSIRKV
jgi:PIN domain nuclease of toxin-antitoxin system